MISIIRDKNKKRIPVTDNLGKKIGFCSGKRERLFMGGKEFLKPNKERIILTIILLILGLIGYFVPNVFFYWLSIIISFPLIIFNLFTPYLNHVLDIAELTRSLSITLLVFLITFGVLIIYFYLLSCLILWIYDKVRKNNLNHHSPSSITTKGVVET
jgi:predicted membrane protein